MMMMMMKTITIMMVMMIMMTTSTIIIVIVITAPIVIIIVIILQFLSFCFFYVFCCCFCHQHYHPDPHCHDHYDRAVNNAVLDTYQLKSLDGLGEIRSTIALQKAGDKVKTVPSQVKLPEHPNVELEVEVKKSDNAGTRLPYDKVIRCLGFTFDSSVFRSVVWLEGFCCLLASLTSHQRDCIIISETDQLRPLNVLSH